MTEVCDSSRKICGENGFQPRKLASDRLLVRQSEVESLGTGGHGRSLIGLTGWGGWVGGRRGGLPLFGPL